MNKKNIKILILFILTTILFSLFYRIAANSLSKVLEEKRVNNTNTNTKINNIKVSLSVQEKKYTTEIKEGATVLDLMQKIQMVSDNENPFDFKYSEHMGLGVFINEINGKSGGRDGYWIYYVNDIKAGVGVSNYKIKNGDIISWKYEK